MNKPRIGKAYVLVRRQGQAVEYTEFTRYSDGSACFTEGGFIQGNDNAADAWRHTLAHLAALGFEELGEAKARGLVPPDWQAGVAWRPDAQG